MPERWNPTLINAEVLAVHAALLKTGEILYFGGDEHDPARFHAHNIDHTRLYNCATGTITTVGSPGFDTFCCGHAMDVYGNILVAGGTSKFDSDPDRDHEGADHTVHFAGLRDASSFDTVTRTWHTVVPMLPEPGSASGGGRWYPTLLTLPDGGVLAMSGHPLESDSRHNNDSVEAFYGNYWRLLLDHCPDHNITFYPRLHVLPDGSIFCSSPVSGRTQKLFITGTPRWADICAIHGDGEYYGIGTASVLLPIRPADGYRPKILLCGSATAKMIDLSAATPLWRDTSARAIAGNPVRRNVNAIILPTGEIFVCGGVTPDASNRSLDAGGVRKTEIYTAETNTWRTGADATVVRNYHSVALLMPDGRVWTAGSNHDSRRSFDTPGVDNRELRIEIYEPWYYGRADRPHLTSLPNTIHGMQEFSVRSGAGETISHVAIIRAGSSTHAFNPDQRYVELSFINKGGNLLQVKAPPNNNIAPPGSYLLFLLNSAGVPSEGKFLNFSITPASLVNRAGDFDGDGIAEILVTSPWGIGVFRQTGSTLSPLLMAPNGTRFGGWLLNTADNSFGEVADYDGDGHDEVLVTSPWGIAMLKLSGGTFTAPMLQPNGTRFGGWVLNTADNNFGPAANYDGDRNAEIFVTSPWGIAILKLSGSTLSALMMQPNGSRFGGWLLNTADNDFGPAADYDGDRRAEILVRSPWGIGILKLSGATMAAPLIQPNGTRFGGWLLNTGDNNFGPSGDYDGDGQAEILVTSPWGIGILKQAGTTMSAPMMAPNGTRFGGWLLNTTDNDFGASADYDGDGRPELFVESPWGIGFLKLSGATLTVPMMAPNGTRFGGWLLNTADNRFGSVGKYGRDPMVNIFVTSPWGIALFRLSGSTLTAPMMQPNGTRFGGWLLNTADNVF